MFCTFMDTLELFGGSLDQLRTVWEDEVRPEMPARTAKTGMTTATQLFENVTDVIRDAARIPQDRRLQPENILPASRYGPTSSVRFNRSHNLLVRVRIPAGAPVM